MTLLDTYLRYVEDYKFSTKYDTWSFLSCIGGLLERRVWVDEGLIGNLYPNIYVVLVGPPASKKSTTARVAVDTCIKEISPPLNLSSDELTPAALIKEFKTISHSSPGALSSPLFAFASELSILTTDIGGGEIFRYLIDFYDTRRHGEMWKKNTIKSGKEEFVNPSLALLACTTPDQIQKSKLIETAGLGFSGRTIWVCEPFFVPGTTEYPEVKHELRKQIRKECTRIRNLKGEMFFTPEARAFIREQREAINAWFQENPMGSSMFSEYMARKVDQIRKVSLILSACQDNRKVIELSHVMEASKLLTELEPTIMDAFGMMISYRDKSLMHKILNKIPFGSSVTENQIFTAFKYSGQAIPDSLEFKEALRGLLKMNCLEEVPKGTLVGYKRK